MDSPGVKHRHDATSATGVTHMDIQEMHEVDNVEWLEHVSEPRYDAPL